MTIEVTSEFVLNLRMQPNDADAETIGDYLVKLLANVWNEGEGFSGKRPFGNSGWKMEIGEALVRAGVIDGKWDSDDEDPEYRWLDTYDHAACNRIVAAAIQALRPGAS
jgi:hypothetical protein